MAGNDEAAPAGGAETGTSGAGVAGLKPLVDGLSNAATRTAELGKAVAGIPGLQSLGEPLMTLSAGLSKAGTLLNDIVSSVESNKENGGVSVALGVADTVLGALNAGNEGEGGEDSEEGRSFLEKAQEKIGQLKTIWDSYYKDLFDKDKKLNLEKAKNLALEVGDVILGSKKMAKVRKALAIANVVRNTAEAVMVAAKSAPLPFNLPAIAQAVALGAAQLGTVKGQAHDGINNIPSTGTYLLERGERVVDSRLNTDLSGFLNAQNGAARTSNNVTSDNRSSSVTNAPVINLSIGSDADENAVSSNRGAAETMIREIFADYAMDAPFG